MVSVLMEIVTANIWNLHCQSQISPDLRVLLYCNARLISVVIQSHTLHL